MGNAGRKCQKRVRSLIADADTSNCYADELTICGAGVEINFKSVSRSNRTEVKQSSVYPSVSWLKSSGPQSMRSRESVAFV